MENILHIDMDAFYASIEENENPQYKNKPLAVVGYIGNRSVISTANYAARKYQIYSAMPLQTALKKLPGLVIIQANFKKYSEVSHQVKKILEKYSSEIEQSSIDEFYIDVRGSHLLFGSSVEIAEKIKKDIRKHLNLTCSIGISYIKLLSKIASDLRKPDGLTIINKDNFNKIMDNLKIEKIPGIGSKTAGLLHKRNIFIIRELRNQSLQELKRLLGLNGYYLYNAVRGIGERNLSAGHKIKSISHEITLEYDTMDVEQIKKLIMELSERTGRKLRQCQLKAKTIKVKLRYYDFKTINKQVSLKDYTDVTNTISRYGIEMINDLIIRPVRLIGIGVSSLLDEKENQQMKLFEENKKQEEFQESMDSLNKKFGDKIIKRGSLV